MSSTNDQAHLKELIEKLKSEENKKLISSNKEKKRRRINAKS